MTIQAGKFWVAEIPFTNGLDTKKRPVLVLWLDGDDIVVAVVTSAKPRTQTDVALNDGNSRFKSCFNCAFVSAGLPREIFVNWKNWHNF